MTVGLVVVSHSRALGEAARALAGRDAVPFSAQCGTGPARRRGSSGRRWAAREIGDTEAAIFDAQLLLLDDPGVLADTGARIDAGTDAARAWADVLDEVEGALAAAADEYMRARARDLRDVSGQVLRALGGVVETGAERDGIVVADDLTPADAAVLDPARTPAVVLAGGSPTAHAAILLRARGVPAVVGVGAALAARAAKAAQLAVDGTTGEVIVDPDPSTLDAFRERAAARHRRLDGALRARPRRGPRPGPTTPRDLGNLHRRPAPTIRPPQGRLTRNRPQGNKSGSGSRPTSGSPPKSFTVPSEACGFRGDPEDG